MTDRPIIAQIQAEAANEYLRDCLELLALTAEVPIEDEDGNPRKNFELVDDIGTRIANIHKELKALRAGTEVEETPPCPRCGGTGWVSYPNATGRKPCFHPTLTLKDTD